VIWHESSLIGLEVRPLNRKDNTARQTETNMSQTCLQRTQTHVYAVNITSSTCLFYLLKYLNIQKDGLWLDNLDLELKQYITTILHSINRKAIKITVNNAYRSLIHIKPARPSSHVSVKLLINSLDGENTKIPKGSRSTLKAACGDFTVNKHDPLQGSWQLQLLGRKLLLEKENSWIIM